MMWPRPNIFSGPPKAEYSGCYRCELDRSGRVDLLLFTLPCLPMPCSDMLTCCAVLCLPDHKHATSTATRHPYGPASNKSLTFAPKRARPSIIRISSGREFQRRHA
ncbi:hypothetical protein J6590_056003 [Homalodisca vitripennis]|nr:hypothetical protein J6590_056003 [Homalodisca vitripennis]